MKTLGISAMSLLSFIVVCAVFVLNVSADEADSGNSDKRFLDWWFGSDTTESPYLDTTEDPYDYCDDWWWSWWCQDGEGEGGETDGHECPLFDSWACYDHHDCYVTYTADGCEQCVCRATGGKEDVLQTYLSVLLAFFEEDARLLKNMADQMLRDIAFTRALTHDTGHGHWHHHDYVIHYKRAADELKKRRVSRDLHLNLKRHQAEEKKREVMSSKKREEFHNAEELLNEKHTAML